MKKVAYIFLFLSSFCCYSQTLEKRFLKSFEQEQQELFEAIDEPENLEIDTSNSSNEIFRFTWLPSFNNPVIFTLKRENEKITAIGKFIYLDKPENYGNIDSIKVDTIKLNFRQWYDFREKVVRDSYFWFLPKNCILPLSDGAAWIYEARKAEKSNKVILQSPNKNSSIAEIGYFIANIFNFENLY